MTPAQGALHPPLAEHHGTRLGGGNGTSLRPFPESVSAFGFQGSLLVCERGRWLAFKARLIFSRSARPAKSWGSVVPIPGVAAREGLPSPARSPLSGRAGLAFGAAGGVWAGPTCRGLLHGQGPAPAQWTKLAAAGKEAAPAQGGAVTRETLLCFRTTKRRRRREKRRSLQTWAPRGLRSDVARAELSLCCAGPFPGWASRAFPECVSQASGSRPEVGQGRAGLPQASPSQRPLF